MGQVGEGVDLDDEETVHQVECSRSSSVRRWFAAKGLGLGLWWLEDLEPARGIV
jgi:hypothetical protein